MYQKYLHYLSNDISYASYTFRYDQLSVKVQNAMMKGKRKSKMTSDMPRMRKKIPGLSTAMDMEL